jgi:hypothetical protein
VFLKMDKKMIMATSVDEMMAYFAKKCFSKEQTVDIFDSITVATIDKNGDFVDKLLQGHHTAMKKPATPLPVKRQRSQQAGEHP